MNTMILKIISRLMEKKFIYKSLHENNIDNNDTIILNIIDI